MTLLGYCLSVVLNRIEAPQLLKAFRHQISLSWNTSWSFSNVFMPKFILLCVAKIKKTAVKVQRTTFYSFVLILSKSLFSIFILYLDFNKQYTRFIRKYVLNFETNLGFWSNYKVNNDPSTRRNLVLMKT